MAGKSSKGRSRRGVNNSASSLESSVTCDTSQNDSLSVSMMSKSIYSGASSELKSSDTMLNTEESSGASSGNQAVQGEVCLYSIPVKTQSGQKIELQLNPGDSVMDIRQFLLDAPETCYVTCYELLLYEKNGSVHHLEDHNEISEVADITSAGCYLEMVPAFYDDRSIRAHVHRARELLSLSSLHSSLSTSLALRGERPPFCFANSPDALKVELSDLDGLALLEDVKFSLHKLFPPLAKEIKCLEHLMFSSFNPPPSYRRLAGDLIYLDVVTLENNKFCITGSTRSFYVNASAGNILDPRPGKACYAATTLIGLLQIISAKFSKAFPEVLDRKFAAHPYENIQSVLSPNSWLGIYPIPDHKRDATRAESALVLSYGSELIGMQRDWNEELQSCRDFPHSTPQERILRDRALCKVTSDFVDATVRGAVGVINGCIPPINPTDPECFHMYVHNNIFFSFAVDSDMEKPLKTSTINIDSEDGRTDLACGSYEDDNKSTLHVINVVSNVYCHTASNSGDLDAANDLSSYLSSAPQFSETEQATYASANNDLKGTRAYQEADIPGLYNLAMAIIDYRGHRVIAQSVLPGILQGDKSNSLLYGSVDHGKKICWNEEVHVKVLEAAKFLHLKEHSVTDASGNVVKLAAPVECKGIVGSDDRHYILDLMRVTPRDANYRETCFNFCILRPELISSFCQRGGNDNAAVDRECNSTFTDTVGCCEEVVFNPNVFTEFQLAGSKEEIAADEEIVKKVALYLKESAVPKFIQDLCTLEVSPMDGQTLTEALHAHGINVRYIGKVANGARHLPHIWDLCACEIVVRSAKHIIKRFLRDAEDHDLSTAISHFFNCFFGNCESLSESGDSNVHARAAVKDHSHHDYPALSSSRYGKFKDSRSRSKDQSLYMLYSSKILWSEIASFAKFKYQFELPEDAQSHVQKVCVLRNLCQKVGVRIVARVYDFDASDPFQSHDILDLQPVVKHSIPVSSEARHLVEKGKVQLAEGMLSEAYTSFSEGLAILQQVTGPMHRDVANCCRYLAMVLYHAGDITGAIMQQQKELIINERCLGLDHPDTAHSYGNLALFYHGLAQTEIALRHISRALLLLGLSCGQEHPDVASTFINVAMMYQDIGKMDTALRYLQEALKKNERLLGEEHIQTAVCYHALAIAFNCMGAFKLSHQHEKKTYDILVKQVGEEDPRTQDSHNWLKTFKMRELQMSAQKQKGQFLDAASARKAIDILKACPDLIRAFQTAPSGKSEGSALALNKSNTAMGSGCMPRGRGNDVRAARAAAEARKKAAARGILARPHGLPVQSQPPLTQLLNIINSGISDNNGNRDEASEGYVGESAQDSEHATKLCGGQTPVGLGNGLAPINGKQQKANQKTS